MAIVWDDQATDSGIVWDTPTGFQPSFTPTTALGTSVADALRGTTNPWQGTAHLLQNLFRPAEQARQQMAPAFQTLDMLPTASDLLTSPANFLAPGLPAPGPLQILSQADRMGRAQVAAGLAAAPLDPTTYAFLPASMIANTPLRMGVNAAIGALPSLAQPHPNLPSAGIQGMIAALLAAPSLHAGAPRINPNERLPGVPPESWMIPAEPVSPTEASQAAHEAAGLAIRPEQIAWDQPAPAIAEPPSAMGAMPALYPKNRFGEGGFVALPSDQSAQRAGEQIAAKAALAPTFYSHLEQTLQDKMPNAASPEQVRGIINSSGVNQEELANVGLEDFLNGKTKVTKAETLQYVQYVKKWGGKVGTDIISLATGYNPAETAQVHSLDITPTMRAEVLGKGQRRFGGFVALPSEESAKQASQQVAAAAVRPIQAPTEVLPEAQARAQRVVEAVKTAKPVRAAQEQLYGQARSQKLAKLLSARSSTTGEASLGAELGALKGALPKAQYESVRPAVGQADIDGLFNDITSNATIGPWEKLNAKVGLAKLFGESGGQVPTRGELDLLGKVFGPELPKALLAKRTLAQRFGQNVAELLNLPRSLMASFDMSAPLRQGVFLIGRPQQWLPAFGSMVRQFFSPTVFEQVQREITQRPTYAAMQDAGLSLTDIGGSLSNREEVFMSRLGEKIPVISTAVKASNRAYVGFLNKLRADVFDSLYADGQRLGIAEQPHFLQSLGSFVNAATGRGPLGPLERAAVPLNSIFFSPRLMASRMALLNPAYYIGLEPTVRREALKSLLTFAGAGATVLSLAKLSGASVGTDPRSADFGKIKVGNTRYDIWGGFQQYLVAATRLLSGQMVSSVTGREFALGEGYKSTTRLDIAARVFESKEAPVLSFVTALLKDKDTSGQPLNVPAAIADRFIPMAVQDMHDIAQEKGASHIWEALPTIFGSGVQTYGTQIPMNEKTAMGRPKVAWRQPPTLGEEAVNALTGTKVTNIPAWQQPGLQRERAAKQQQSAQLDAAKRRVLETGRSETVGNVRVYLERGIVKTKKQAF